MWNTSDFFVSVLARAREKKNKEKNGPQLGRPRCAYEHERAQGKRGGGENKPHLRASEFVAFSSAGIGADVFCTPKARVEILFFVL